MRSIFTFLISGFLLLGASSRALAQHITPENSSIDVAAAAGSASVNVDSDVSWTASADETWITSAVNNGSGQLEIAYEENTTTSPRDAIITLTDGSINATVTVNQAGAAPVLNVNPSSRSAAKGGETVTFSVSSNITWSAVDDAGWLELSNSSNQISATAAANNTVEERTATITVSGSGVSSVNVTVIQAPGDASVSVTPSNRNVTSPAGSTTFDVTSNTTWSASDDAGWLTLSNASNQITANFTENTSTDPRTATITVTAGSASQDVTVTQAGAAAYITPSSTTVNVGSGDSQTSVSVSSNVTWTVDENVSWFTASKNGTSLDIDYDANPGTSNRSGDITLNSTEGATATVTVTQAGAAAYITPSSTTVNVGSGDSQTSVSVSSNVTWTVEENVSWFTASKNGSNLDIDYDANPGTSSRSGDITLNSTEGATATVTVTQAGAAAYITPSSTTVNVGSGDSQTSVSVSSNVIWTVDENVSWLTASKNGNNLDINYDANPGISNRSGDITLNSTEGATATVTVTQAGAAANLSINPTTASAAKGGQTLTFDITSNISWNSSVDKSWVTLTPSANQISAVVAANNTVSSRTATITVTGTGVSPVTATITQAAGDAYINPAQTTLTPSSAKGQSKITYTTNITSISANSNAPDWLTYAVNGFELTIKYEANDSVMPRSGVITLTGNPSGSASVTVNQAGAAPVLNAEPELREVTSSAGSTTFSVTANFAGWTVSKTGEWITSAVKNGNTINVAYTANDTVIARTGKIIAKGVVSGTTYTDTVTVSQAAAAPNITVAPNPSAAALPYTAGSKDFTVTSNFEWKVEDNAEWLISGRNGTTLGITYELNSAITSRQAVITVTQLGVSSPLVKQYTVTQSAAPAFITPDEAAVNIGNSSGTASVNVNSNVNWTPAESISWLSAVKNGTKVDITYDANLTVSQRSGTINLSSSQGGSAAITVTQAAGLPFITPSSTEVSVNVYTSGSSSVDISSNVAWSASESSDWFSIAYNSGSITINYTENMTVFPRTGSITVTGSDVTKTINVSQVAGPERLDVNPLTKEVPYQEGGASFTVTANKAWTVSENLNWVVIPPESIENNKFVASINSNPSADSRTGNIIVKSGSLTKTISLTQLGAPPEIDAEPENSEVPYTAGTGFFTVTSNFSNWAAADEADWLTVTKSGSQVNFSYQENKTVSARIGKVIVSGRSVSDTVLVTQQAGLSDLNVTPINRDAAYTAGETSFDVTANVEWTVTEDAGWLTAAKSGTQILVTFEENPSTNSRTGKLTLSGGSITHELTVTQEGRPEEIMLTPASIEVAYTTGATSFSVAVNTASWSVSEGEYWLEVATSGSKTNITYEANTSVNIRTGKITVKAGDSSKVFTITQRGTPTAISSNPAGANVSFLEGAASFTITSNVEWTVSDNADWLTSVKNVNVVQVNYAKNNLREQRQGIITVSGGGYSLDIILTQGGNLEVSKPLLIAPANNLYKSGLNLLFEWHKPALADEYSLEISDSVQFTNIIYSYKDITDSVYTIASLKEGVKYFWRIKAANSYGYSTYSDVWSFTSKLLQPGNLRISQNAFDEVVLSWQDNSINETGYDILRKSGDGQFIKLTSVPSGQVNYIDAEIPSSGLYTYRVYAFNAASVSDTSEVSINVTIIGVNDDPMLDIPTEYSLSEAYPNPFNPSAKIRYGIPEESAVVIEVFNILGERVETLLNEQVSAGYHEMRWNAYNMPSGIYIIRTYAKSVSSDRKFVSVKKAMLLK